MQLLHQLHRRAADRPEQLAVRECCSGKALTYRQLNQRVGEFASRLKSASATPSTYLLHCGNRIEFHIAFLACLFAGHRVFPMACDAVEMELKQAATRSDAIGLIREDLSVHSLATVSAAKIESGLLLQSSGTTGLPKIVCRLAHSVDAAARQIVEAIELTPSDHIFTCVPLSHSYGIEHGLLAAIDAGASVHLGQGFDIGIIGRELVESKITILPAVPAVFEMLSQFSDLPAKFPHLRLAYSAGGPLPTDVNETFLRRFGLRIGQIYGASEFGSITFSDPAAIDFDPQSVGKPMKGVELQIDPDGQLLVRARSLMHGYLDADSPFTSDGFFPTGDLARIEGDGRLILTGRLKLLMDIGGRKVNPLEVEEALRQHPKVVDCVVVAIEQTQTLRRLKAIIVPADTASSPSPEELRQFLKDRLSPYKIPRVFECRASFPRSPAGKILRHLLEPS